MNAKTIVTITIGVASVATLVCADVQGWTISTMVSGMLGSLFGAALGYLAPSPIERRSLRPERVEVGAPKPEAATVREAQP